MEEIDLRSDTVTRPGPGMRRAMAEAEVGDDVYNEDPTVRRLEERVADLLGAEAALFVPTGTMANQIALRALVRPGDEVMIGAGAHVWMFESGALAALAGAQTQVLPGDGRFTAADVRAAWKPDEFHLSPTTVVAVENTHNMGGGLLWDRADLAAVQAAARELQMSLHLDGARLWNAAIAQGVSERVLAAGFDTVSVCLSKGLGAPAGSLVASTSARVALLRRYRKMYGGGMRQVGVLAAAGHYALDHHRQRLAEDHDNARLLADRLTDVAGLRVDPSRVDTNIVMVDLEGTSAGAVIRRARERGLRLGAAHATRIRLVTHLDVDRAACLRAVDLLAASVAAARAA
jgi:threonine aldolase